MTIEELVAQGLAILNDDPQHDLRLGFRCQIWSLIDKAAARSAAKRVAVASLAAVKVMPVWDAFFPDDQSPRKALEVANSLIEGRVSAGRASEQLSDWWSHFDNLSWRHKDKRPAIMVGYGAAQVIREALSERHFGCNNISENSTDFDVDPYDHDAAFCAAVASAGGVPGDRRADAKNRLEFWTWWLTSAVPTALVP